MAREQLVEKLDEFLSFYNDIDKRFVKKIAKQIEIDTVAGIREIIKESSEPCSLPEQIRLNKRLATLMITLGSLASERVKQANVAFRWLRWKRHKEWSPAKKFIGERVEKVLVGDIEEEVAKRTFGEELVESNMQGIADWLTTLHRDATSYKSALQRQIDYNIKEYGLAQHTAE